ncbi:hypothetical protein [Delftia tsuruhatensis]|uniref:hypothetical protein n=1 Tax=Delftia tsuruhatensis TaxID=180282 RepID=UPI0024441B7A|nr:hypothetical protein [Delftia tsuruhatensis]MDH1461829.1 hypothetical protein [Delftia tsuruhatensis]WGG09992.1 hypothetical protein N5O86_25610 [Delftia tsuruhatensis]
MKKEHKYAQALRWMADGEIVQIKWERSGGWLPMNARNEYVNDQVLRGLDGYEFRLKPKTILVGDREIEAPVMSGPGYYITDHGDAFRWFGEATLDPGANLQKLGRIYATEEAARAAQEAITALLTREPS